MPSVKLNRNVLEKLIGKKLSTEKLKERICYIGTDLESIDANEIDVEIFPNRPDMLSEQGFARALSSFIGVRTGLREYDVKDSGEKVIIDKSVSDVRPYTACAIVKNLKFDDEKIKEIIQIQEKLHITYGRNRKKAAIGIYPYEKIRPPIGFIAKKPKDIKFRPLEFPREVTGLQILSQHPAGREYGKLLQGMDKFPIFIDSDNNVLSMPPIINSHDVGKISEKTGDVFIECSGFDLRVLQKCLNMIVTSLADMGGEIYSMRLEYSDKKVVTPNLKPEEMNIDIDYVNKRLGLELKEKDVKILLERMGFGYKNKKVLIPSYRADILHQVDLIEDIAIAYGYENFKEDVLNVAGVGEENKFEVFKKRIGELLSGLGLLETKTYNITNKEFQSKLMECDIKCVELLNPNSSEYDCLRAWVIPSLLDVLRNNKQYEYPQKIFDIGSVFKADDKSESGVIEAFRIGVALCGEKSDFTEIKQILDYIMDNFGMKYNIEEVEHDSFISGRVGRVVVNNVRVAYIGEISPKVLSNFDLEMPVACLELNLSELYKNKKN